MMPIDISANFAFECDQPTDVLLQFEAANLPEQAIEGTDTQIRTTGPVTRVPAQDNIGERIWLRGEGRIEVEYSARVSLRRTATALDALSALPPHKLPGETVPYLLDSRYCPADQFQNFVEQEFAGTSGGARIDAIRAYAADHIEYAPGASGPYTDAAETFIARKGICRDYAHVVVTLARASAIPARYVACYAPGVIPQDFHAVAEVFLADPEHKDGGIWHLVDATGMAQPLETAKIGIGRDAADVSFLTSFGVNRFLYSQVKVETAA